jgi:hypothetical protein
MGTLVRRIFVEVADLFQPLTGKSARPTMVLAS